MIDGVRASINRVVNVTFIAIRLDAGPQRAILQNPSHGWPGSKVVMHGTANP